MILGYFNFFCLNRLMLAGSSFGIFLISAWTTYLELKKKNHVLFMTYKYGRNELTPINSKSRKRLNVILTLLTYYLFYIVWPFTLNIALSGCLYTAYLGLFHTEYNKLNLLFWNIFYIGFSIQLIPCDIVGCILITMCTFYLKYKFNDINDKIRRRVAIKAHSLGKLQLFVMSLLSIKFNFITVQIVYDCLSSI